MSEHQPEGIGLSRMLGGGKHDPIVYFIRHSDTVKIGTTTCLMNRLGNLSLPLRAVIMVTPGGRDVEDAYHVRFSAQLIYGEWFSFSGELAEFLDPWIDHAAPVPIMRTGGPNRVPVRVHGDGKTVIGLGNGAAFLGLTQHAFEKRRVRSGPIPGEVRQGNRPAWSMTDLTSWASRWVSQDAVKAISERN